MNEEEELRDVERVKKDTERLRKLKNRELQFHHAESQRL